MPKIVYFEMKKIVKTNFFQLIVLSILMMVAIFYGLTNMNAKKIKEKQMLTDSNIIVNWKEENQGLKELIDLGVIEKNEIAAMQSTIDFFDSLIESAEKRVEGYEEKDWPKVLSTYIEFDEQVIEEQQQMGYELAGPGRSLFTLLSTQEQNNLIRERNIEPIFPVDISTTIYDQFETEDEKKNMQLMAKRYSSNGLYFTYTVQNVLFGIVGIALFVFLFGDVITKEGYGNNGPIHFLHTQPVKRNKIVVSKFIAVFLLTLSVILSVCGLSLLLGSIINRFGDGNYPILIYGENDTFSFMNVQTFVLKSLGLFLMVILVCYSLLFLLSILTRNTLQSVGGTLVIVFIGIELSGQSFISKIAPYFPFSYFSVEKVLSGETAFMFENFDITFTSGVIVLAISFICISYISYLLYPRFQ